MEQCNARDLGEDFPERADLAVMDVSFISQSLIYPAVVQILKPEGIFISLIKPQFEVGRQNVGKGGIVKSEAARKGAIEALRLAAREAGLRMEQVIPSPIEGGDGNREYLAYFTRISTGKESL
jgi:23S rRNA (cytidine1920-2'-O)/16S rRNA (cytidine1409-2'-O)-methyltransferase